MPGELTLRQLLTKTWIVLLHLYTFGSGLTNDVKIESTSMNLNPDNRPNLPKKAAHV